uniref:NADH-ubiquinone oxidoreductase chain 3 n=1 Tax=Lernaea cyprinacea TaxID=342429 RepID=A0A0U1XC88_9MAXI|nr:NADH dehydrogenase subunit 3 [Lernaea cyprinacea]AIQ80160.1 NADH dehydrogenase subunit 3 [Lernaea cyprinacea]
MLLLLLIVMLVVSLIIFVVGIALSYKKGHDSALGSPFECGFTPFNNYSPSFSVHFFLVAMIFLIFDVELSLMMPYFYTLVSGINFKEYLIISSFLLILLLGLIYEWNIMKLEWKF